MRGPVKARSVQIHPANGGYVVIVGCQTFVYKVGEEGTLVNNLETYLVSPEAVEKEWREMYSSNEPEQVPTPYGLGSGVGGYSR